MCFDFYISRIEGLIRLLFFFPDLLSWALRKGDQEKTWRRFRPSIRNECRLPAAASLFFFLFLCGAMASYKIEYQHSVQPSEALILEFQNIRTAPIIVWYRFVVFRLPAPCDGFSRGVCGQSQSSKQHVTENQQKFECMDIVTASHAPWAQYRPTQNDSPARKAEKKKHFSDDLLRHTSNKTNRQQNGANWNWDDFYYVILSGGTKAKVCKQAWYAITGVTKDMCEYSQKGIRLPRPSADHCIERPQRCKLHYNLYLHK